MSHAPAHVDAPRAASDASSRRRWLALGALVYVGIAAATLWSVLALSVDRATTCACSDSSLFAWFFEWPLVAISHGHNPFYSSQMFHPMGINLLSNTSVTAWSFLLLPVTALFGPVASLNVALLLAPALSGVATMWVALRWVRSPVVAFLAGALYAFSPLVLFQGAGAHLMVTSLAVPPLVLACLDELFWRRRHSPRKVGVALGLLVVVQFFTGTEVLTMLAVATAGGLAVLGVAALVSNRDAAVGAVRHGLPGLVRRPRGRRRRPRVAGVLRARRPRALRRARLARDRARPSIDPQLPRGRAGHRARWLPHHSYRFVRPTYLGPALVATMLVGLVVCGGAAGCARWWR